VCVVGWWGGVCGCGLLPYKGFVFEVGGLVGLVCGCGCKGFEWILPGGTYASRLAAW
jgi:hypothetical protein